MATVLHPTQTALSYRRVFWFWIPLAAMWFMMAVEQPLIASFVARMADPELNLAAYGVVFSIALIIESPVIMLLAAGTALSRGAHSYRRLLRFSHIMIGGLTAVHVLIAFTPLFDLILLRVIGTPREVAALGRGAFLVLVPWTAAVGYRRLWQGVLIRHDRTGVVPVTIALRLAVTAVILVIGYSLERYSGVFVGAAALTGGVLAAAVAAHLFARPVIRQNLQDPVPETNVLCWRELISFYVPLALTSLILLAARPLLTVAISRLPRPLDSLAVWPVLLSVSFLGRSIAMSYQEVGIALLQDRQGYELLQRFARILGGVMLLLFVGFAVSPLAEIWFRRVVGLSAALTGMTRLPVLFIALLPALGAVISWKRGILVTAKRTPAITRSVLVNLMVLGALLIVLSFTLQANGALIAAIAYAGSVGAEWLYLHFAVARAKEHLFPSSGSFSTSRRDDTISEPTDTQAGRGCIATKE
jgi:hypothetical protein